MHGDDDGPSQQGPGGPTAHHGAQHCLAIIHRGPGGAQTGTHIVTHTHKETLFSGTVTEVLVYVRHGGADRGKHSSGAVMWQAALRTVPHVVLPLNRHIHLIHSALRNGPCWNEQTHPWGAQNQTDTQTDRQTYMRVVSSQVDQRIVDNYFYCQCMQYCVLQVSLVKCNVKENTDRDIRPT